MFQPLLNRDRHQQVGRERVTRNVWESWRKSHVLSSSMQVNIVGNSETLWTTRYPFWKKIKFKTRPRQSRGVLIDPSTLSYLSRSSQYRIPRSNETLRCTVSNVPKWRIKGRFGIISLYTCIYWTIRGHNASGLSIATWIWRSLVSNSVRVWSILLRGSWTCG